MRSIPNLAVIIFCVYTTTELAGQCLAGCPCAQRNEGYDRGTSQREIYDDQNFPRYQQAPNDQKDAYYQGQYQHQPQRMRTQNQRRPGSYSNQISYTPRLPSDPREYQIEENPSFRNPPMNDSYSPQDMNPQDGGLNPELNSNGYMNLNTNPPNEQIPQAQSGRW